MVKSDSGFARITHGPGAGGFAFTAAYVGAVIYFYNQSPDFWGFVLALLKALVWPGFVVYHGLAALGA